MLNAEQGIQELKQYVDSLIVIPNERLLSILDKSTSANQAFDKPNEVLYEATRGIADIITVGGIINVDFADVRSVMSQSGEALMGCGMSSGENRAIEAAQKAISSPLLEGVSIKGAKNILLNVTGSSSLTMQEIDEGNKVIYDAAGEEANVIFGWVNKEEMNEYVSYTVIATGFDSAKKYKETAVPQQQVHQAAPQKTSMWGGVSKTMLEQKEFEFAKDFSKSVNYDIPTILRVKGTNSPLLGENTTPKSGFPMNEHESYFDDKRSDKNSGFEDDDESSSFLRMMMD
jgi:cell division protein FtsZ